VFKLFGERVFDRNKDMGRLEDSLVRGFRRVMAFNGFRADLCLEMSFMEGQKKL